MRPPHQINPDLAVRYVADLAKKNSEALSFIPTPRLEQYACAGQMLVALDNDEPCGFIVFGAGWPQLRVYQACIQYDTRRRDYGMALVGELVRLGREAGHTDVRLWCASDLDANAFWSAAGFVRRAERAGGTRRGRRHVLWAFEINEPPLLKLAGRAA